MGQIPKNIILAQAGTKLTFKINGKLISLDEESIDSAAKSNLDKLVSSGELPQHRIKEYWDTHQKFKENAKKGVYNIDTAGSGAVAGMTYEGEASPEVLGLTEEGETAERGAIGRFFTKTIKRDPAAIMSRYNVLAGESIGGLGLRKIDEDEASIKAQQEKSKAEENKAKSEQKSKEDVSAKLIPISQYIQETRFGGSGKWEPLWKSMSESERFDVLSKHAQDIITNKEKYFKDKDTSWMTKFQKNGDSRFSNLDELRDFYSHIYGGEGLEYLDEEKKTLDSGKQLSRIKGKEEDIPSTITNEEFFESLPQRIVNGVALPARPSFKHHIIKENISPVINESKKKEEKSKDLQKLISERIQVYEKQGRSLEKVSNINARDAYQSAKDLKEIQGELSKGIDIEDYINNLTKDTQNIKKKYQWIWSSPPNVKKEYNEKARKLAKLQKIKSELPTMEDGGILKGQAGFSFPDLLGVLEQSNIKIPFAAGKQPTTQGITVPFAVGKAPVGSVPTSMSRLNKSATDIGKGYGTEQSGISKLVQGLPKMSEDTTSNLRELARVAILNKLQPDITVEAPMITPAAEIRTPVRGDYTTIAAASQEAAKLRGMKPMTSDAVLAEMSAQEREGKAGEIEMQGKMADLQARKQSEAQDLSLQERYNIGRGEIAARNIQSLAEKRQAEREAKNMLSRQRTENWDTFLAQMNLKKEAKSKETEGLKKQYLQEDLMSKLNKEPIRVQYLKELSEGKVSPQTHQSYLELEQRYKNMIRSMSLGENVKFQFGGTIGKAEAALAKELWKEKIKAGKAFSNIYEKWMNKKVSEQEKDTDRQSKQLYDLVKKALK